MKTRQNIAIGATTRRHLEALSPLYGGMSAAIEEAVSQLHRFHFPGEDTRVVLQVLALQRHTTPEDVVKQLILEERERMLAQQPAQTGKEE